MLADGEWSPQGVKVVICLVPLLELYLHLLVLIIAPELTPGGHIRILEVTFVQKGSLGYLLGSLIVFGGSGCVFDGLVGGLAYGR